MGLRAALRLSGDRGRGWLWLAPVRGRRARPGRTRRVDVETVYPSLNPSQYIYTGDTAISRYSMHVEGRPAQAAQPKPPIPQRPTRTSHDRGHIDRIYVRAARAVLSTFIAPA